MSMDYPNEYEHTIEDYAEACRDLKDAEAASTKIMQEIIGIRERRTKLLACIRDFLESGKIKPGIYRLRKSSTLYAEGIAITDDGKAPVVYPMFR